MSLTRVLSAVLTMILVGACLRFSPPAEATGPFDLAARSVVKLAWEGGGATGFLVRSPHSRPLIITNWHACSASGGTAKASREGEFSDVILTIVKSDISVDLCAMTEAPGLALVLSKKDSLSPWTKIFVLGHPYLEPQTPVEGRFFGEETAPILFNSSKGGCPSASVLMVTFEGFKCLVQLTMGNTTTPIHPGNSGSPAMDSDGEVVGVINATLRDNQGSFIPVRYLRKLIGDL